MTLLLAADPSVDRIADHIAVAEVAVSVESKEKSLLLHDAAPAVAAVVAVALTPAVLVVEIRLRQHATTMVRKARLAPSSHLGTMARWRSRENAVGLAPLPLLPPRLRRPPLDLRDLQDPAEALPDLALALVRKHSLLELLLFCQSSSVSE